MNRLRTRTSIVVLCLGIAVFAVLLPSISPLFTAVLAVVGLVFSDAAVTVIRRRAVRSHEQPVSLRSVLLSRAPPATFALL